MPRGEQGRRRQEEEKKTVTRRGEWRLEDSVLGRGRKCRGEDGGGQELPGRERG